MTNTEACAAKWIKFLAARPEFPAGTRLLAAFRVGRITRLCDCGCNSFDIEIPAESELKPIASPGDFGSVFEIGFYTTEQNTTLEFIVHAGRDGHLTGLEVDYCANSYPVPAAPVLLEPPFHVLVSSALA